MSVNVIVISGSPGTGKTSVASELDKIGYLAMNLFDLAEIFECVEGFDEERDTHIVDTDKLYGHLDSFLAKEEGIMIVEGHYGDVVPAQYVTKCFVLTAPTNVLKLRLLAKGYAENKINENLQAEIMQECWVEALDSYGSTRVTRVENMSISAIADLINTFIQVNLG